MHVGKHHYNTLGCMMRKDAIYSGFHLGSTKSHAWCNQFLGTKILCIMYFVPLVTKLCLLFHQNQTV